MSLFSTITHDGAAPARRFSPNGIGMVAAGLALGVGIAFVIVNNRTAVESSDTAGVSAATEAPALGNRDVPWWSTESFKNLAPAASAAATEALGDSNVPWWSTESFKNIDVGAGGS